LVGHGTLQPDPAKIDSVAKMEAPTTKKQLRSFLGSTGYFGKFIPKYADISSSIYYPPEGVVYYHTYCPTFRITQGWNGL